MNRKQRAKVNGMLAILRQWGAYEHCLITHKTSCTTIRIERIPRVQAIVIKTIIREHIYLFKVTNDGEIVGHRMNGYGHIIETVVMELGELS